MPESRSLRRLDEQMAELDPDSLRYKVLASAKQFKSSWIELGQMLFTVWKDRHWRGWGYLEFESYCLKEIGIREATARKLLHSYHFLEQEEPGFLEQQRETDEPQTPCPSYDAVYVLRSAKSAANTKKLPETEYTKLRTKVLERAEEASEVRKELRMMQERLAPEDPEEAREKRRATSLRRLVTNLKTAESVAEAERLIPPPLLKELKALVTKLETLLP